ncbi:beta-amyrin 11-oxidase-like isoform X6 [Scyliorhinus canicula]|uniref:beta-amyrin 11-oxidase-like isoform X6 n=1 Tax=Scyliorhinus canicula TaxID=7830 RepID=UPI0018F7CD21|nr:beta-amyrin 11-oxidase-like isoform X6 [Scyliorhinus canicula]
MSQIQIPGSSGYALMSDKSLEFYKDPMHFCNSRIHSYGSRIFQARLLNKPTLFVCSVKGMKELLCARMSVFEKDPSAVMHELYGDNLVTTEDLICPPCQTGEEAQLLRLSLMQLFRGKMLDSYADYINRVCARNLKDFSLSSEPVAVYTMFKRLATELMLGIFLNADAEESAALSKQITQLSTQHWHGLISAPVKVKVSVWSSAFTQALEAKEKLLNIINERLQSEEDGLISKIKNVPFPENTNATQHLLLFISALIPKALASLLTSFTVELAGTDKINIRKRAQENEDYLNHVLLEVERLWPSFIGGRRIAKQDTTLCGYMVPKGYLALFVAFAVHRDPEIFDNPDEFQPERWSGRNAGQEKLLCCFGNGSRNCIGIDLNNVILKTAAGYLLNHYSWDLDPPNQSLHYKWLPVSRPAEDPKIKFTCSSKT